MGVAVGLIVKVERPPLFYEIAAAFPMAHNDKVVFAWGETVFAPSGGTIPPAILAHEAVHGKRQLAIGIETWWARYIDDVIFRLAEEIPAHQAEYQHHRNSPEGAKPVPGFRCKADWMLLQIAQRLAGPLYGRLVTMQEAKRLILT